MLRSTDGGQTAQRVTNRYFYDILARPSLNQFLAIESGCDANEVLLSEDGGNSWSHIGDTPADRLLNAGRPGSNTVWAYEFDTVKGRIYESLDGGRNWRLFEEQVNAAQFQFTDPQEQPVFVATDNGIYFLSRPSAHSPVAPPF